MKGLVEEPASFAAQLTFEEVPDAVVENAKTRILDTVGIGMAAREIDAARAAHAVALDWGGSSQAEIWGSPERLPGPSAALVNGTFAHALDFDDTHLPSVAHPSASLVAAVLAQAQASEADGRTAVTALVAGYEIFVRLANAQYDPHLRNSVFFERGLHATSIIGTVAGAAACARLRGLDGSGVADAMGVACSMGAGILEANRSGGSVKRAHCGWAAHSALAAAALAEAGLTAPPTVLEGRFGFFQAFCGENWRPDAVTESLGTWWATPEIFFKPYPCNHFTHAVADAAIELRDRGLAPADVEEVEIGTAAASLRTIGEPLSLKQRPQTSYQAAFSGPFVFATALCGGSGLGLTVSDFDHERLADATVAQIARCCSVVADAECDEIFPHQFPAVVRVRTKQGAQLVARVLTTRGGPDRPLDRAELLLKFRDNVGAGADALAESIVGLDGATSVGDAFRWPDSPAS